MRAAVPNRLAQLDARRRWARVRAPMWFTLGVAIMAVGVTGAGAAVVAMLLRAVALVSDRPLRELPIWGWAAGAVIAFAVLGLVIAVLSVTFSVLRHGGVLILRDVGALRLDPRTPKELRAATTAGPLRIDDVSLNRLRNVVDALCLGLGVRSPRLAVVDEAVPNALSVSGRTDETLVVTSGLLGMGRDEVEAVAAHELAHLHARDSRWVTAAAASLGRARGVAHLLEAFAGLLIVIFAVGLEAEVFLITPLLGGLVIGGLALIVDLRVRSAQNRVRAESDEIADVAAVLLARNPAALASVCAALAYRPQRVRRTSWRADHLWFAPLPEPSELDAHVKQEDKSGGWVRRRSVVVADGPAPPSDPESAREVADELARRAAHAYYAAGVPTPPVMPQPQATPAP